MASFIPFSFSTTGRIPSYGIPLFRSQFALRQKVTCSLLPRFKSDSAPHSAAKKVKPAIKHSSPRSQRLQRRSSAQANQAQKVSILLNLLKKASKLRRATPVVKPAKDVVKPAKDVVKPAEDVVKPAEDVASSTVPIASQDKGPNDEITIEIDEEEEAIRRRIVAKRRKILWPGIWTLLALAGTYGTLAYLDVRAGVPSSDGSQLPERVQLPQSWYLTPTIFLEGIKAGWNELDNLTIGIIVVQCAIHLLKRSPLPIRQSLIHITGDRKWTAFTYPFLNTNWKHLVTNAFTLVWFLPGVVRYFDGDLFHTTALLVSVPLITSYLSHFAYRLNLVSGFVLNMGGSGIIAASMGVYCVAYANEKLWLPLSLVFRVDSMYWALAFAASQTYAMIRSPKVGPGPAYSVHIASIGLGAAYAYFDLKHHLWIPLVSEISARRSDTTVEE